MSITASMVKELRESTGAGMMDAKKALTETSGDFEAAVDWLRTKGLAKAAKKSDRVAAEGLVAVFVDGPNGVAIEVNSDTDVVAQNAEFQEMVKGFAGVALNCDSLEALINADFQGKKISEVITDKIATIGENLSLRRIAKISGDQVVSYVHNAAADGMGAIAVLVALKGNNEEFGRQVAMHIAAANPQALNKDDLDPSIIEREKSVLTEQARESGKPEQVIEKMIDGRMKKFLSEVTLLGQDFVIDTDLTVEAAAEQAGGEILNYSRMAVDEGIGKKEEDCAAEDARAARG